MPTPTNRLATASICGRSAFEATPTNRLATALICGRLPFDVTDDNTKVKQKQRIYFFKALIFVLSDFSILTALLY